MSSWKDEFMAALESRDLVEKSNISFYEAYTRLADRSATQQHQEGLDEAAAPTLKSAVKSGAETQVRQDLSAAQQMRADLQSRLTATTVELEKTKAKSKAEGRRMHEMNTEQNQLVVRLRDRDAEIRGKAKLLEDVQDELVSLNLQLNMADEQSKKLRLENTELVDRWMARMGREADAMNEGSKFS